MSRIGDPRLLIKRLQGLSEKIQRNNLSKNRFVENIRERLGVILTKIQKLKLLYQECQRRLKDRDPIDEDDRIEELKRIIRNQEEKNRDHKKEVALLEKEIERLQDEIKKKTKTPPYIPPESDESLRRLMKELHEKETTILELKEKIFNLTRENEKMILQLREEIIRLTRENEQLKRTPPKYTPPPDEITFYKDQLDLRNKELEECRAELAKIKKLSGPNIDQNDFNRLVQENMRLKEENRLLRDNEDIYKQYYEEINEMITDVDNEFSSIMTGVNNIERELDIPELRTSLNVSKNLPNRLRKIPKSSDEDFSDDSDDDSGSKGKPKNPKSGSMKFLESSDAKKDTKSRPTPYVKEKPFTVDTTQINKQAETLFKQLDEPETITRNKPVVKKSNFEIDKSGGGYTKKKRRNHKKRQTKRNKRNKSK